MLGNSPVVAILVSTDLERTKDFYQNKLGLKLVESEIPEGIVFDAGSGTQLFVYKKPEGNKAEHTQAGFDVADFDTTIEELRAKGVVFEDYDLPGLKTENQVADWEGFKSAWFKDPDGNILAINSSPAK